MWSVQSFWSFSLCYKMEVCVFLLLTVLCVGLMAKSTSTEPCAAPLLMPASLLVEYGSSAEVNCSIPFTPTPGYMLGWESKISQEITKTKRNVVWKVDNLTMWDEAEGLQCFFTGNDKCQNSSNVNLTIYKKPSRVFLSLETDVWVEGNETVLRCEIQDVGPGDKLSVRWSRVNQKQSNTSIRFNETTFLDLKNERKDVSRTATLGITPRRKDDGVQYQCAAVLNVGQGHVYSSQLVKTTVHYKPKILQSVDEVHSVTGQRLIITCLADGNPSPNYTWTVPNNTIISNSSSISISSVREEDRGQCTCIARNYLGQATQHVTIMVKADHTILIVIGVVTGVMVLLVLLSVGCCVYYRNTHMEQYILKQLRSHANINHV